MGTVPMSDSNPATDYLDQESLQQYMSSLWPCVTSEPQNEEEPLDSLIIKCAQAAAQDDQCRALSFITALRARVSPNGSGSERMGYYFTEALEARITGKKTSPSPGSIHKLLRIYQFSAKVCPMIGLPVFFINQTILEHMRRFKRLHIVDYGIGHGFSWLCLLKDLSRLPGPPHLRLTGVDVPDNDHHASIVVPIEQTAAKLIAYAKQLGVPFSFNSVVSKDWDLITPSELGIQIPPFRDIDEVLIVTSIYRLRQLRDEPCMGDTPRKRLLRQIVEMRPAVFIQGELTLSSNSPLELRVREALDYYSRLFGAFEEIMADESSSVDREFIENMHGKDVMNMVAFEGNERRERPECYKQWQILAQNSGMKYLKLKKHVYDQCVEMVKSYSGSFTVTKNRNWLIVYWKHYPLSAISAWSTSSASLEKKQ